MRVLAAILIAGLGYLGFQMIRSETAPAPLPQTKPFPVVSMFPTKYDPKVDLDAPLPYSPRAMRLQEEERQRRMMADAMHTQKLMLLNMYENSRFMRERCGETLRMQQKCRLERFARRTDDELRSYIAGTYSERSAEEREQIFQNVKKEVRDAKASGFLK